jgi:hypothetical protein
MKLDQGHQPDTEKGTAITLREYGRAHSGGGDEVRGLYGGLLFGIGEEPDATCRALHGWRTLADPVKPAA